MLEDYMIVMDAFQDYPEDEATQTYFEMLKISQEFNVSVLDVLAVFHRESKYNTKAINPHTRTVGIFQATPYTCRLLGTTSERMYYAKCYVQARYFRKYLRMWVDILKRTKVDGEYILTSDSIGSVVDLYTLNLGPARIRDFVIYAYGTIEYRLNAGLNQFWGDGGLTKRDLYHEFAEETPFWRTMQVRYFASRNYGTFDDKIDFAWAEFETNIDHADEHFDSVRTDGLVEHIYVKEYEDLQEVWLPPVQRPDLSKVHVDRNVKWVTYLRFFQRKVKPYGRTYV